METQAQHVINKFRVYHNLIACPLMNMTAKGQRLFPPFVNLVEYNPNSKDIELTNTQQEGNFRFAIKLASEAIKKNCINCPLVERHKPTTEGSPIENMPGFFNPSIIIQT
jgi:hypothetical protein